MKPLQQVVNHAYVARLFRAGDDRLIEHNLELIQAADWVIDLGPEGGEAGGYIVAQGPPEFIATVPESYTGRYLRQTLAQSAIA